LSVGEKGLRSRWHPGCTKAMDIGRDMVPAPEKVTPGYAVGCHP
jgi:hypothetical protein